MEMAGDVTTQKQANLTAIRNAIGNVCKRNGFSKGGKPFWWRVRGDTIQAIHLDKRIVGKYPYFIEVRFDFISAGATPGASFNIMPVGFNIERTMPDQDAFLKALAPEMEFGSIEHRCQLIEARLQDKLENEIDKLVNIETLRQLKMVYTDNNTLNIALRVRERM